MTYFDVPAVDKSLIDLICKNVGYGSTIFPDEYSAYDSLEEHGFIHESVTFRKGIRNRHCTCE
jgi:hypothetical protein